MRGARAHTIAQTGAHTSTHPPVGVGGDGGAVACPRRPHDGVCRRLVGMEAPEILLRVLKLDTVRQRYELLARLFDVAYGRSTGRS